MPDVSAATIDRNIKFNSLSWWEEFKPNIPEQPEQDIGTLPKLNYGIGVEITQEDIPRYEPSGYLYVIAQPEDNTELYPRPWMPESPTANRDLHRTDKNIILVVPSDLLKRFYDITQPEANRAFHPSSLNTEPLSANVDLEHTDQSIFPSEISERFDVIAQREDNWDERESKKPSELALNNAKNLMEELLDAVSSAGYSWLTPFISSDEDGYITVAWHHGEHELHLEIAENEVEYVTVWGIKIDTEMDVGVLNKDNYLTLWKWLLDG